LRRGGSAGTEKKERQGGAPVRTATASGGRKGDSGRKKEPSGLQAKKIKAKKKCYPARNYRRPHPASSVTRADWRARTIEGRSRKAGKRKKQGTNGRGDETSFGRSSYKIPMKES